MLLGLESRQRHAFLDSAQNELENLLQQPAIARVLGEATLDRLVTINRSLVIPNVRNGIVSLPEKYHDTDTPMLVAMKYGETFTVDTATALPTPAERVNVGQIWVGWQGTESVEPEEAVEGTKPLIDFMAMAMREDNRTRSQTLRPGVNGRVHTSGTGFKAGTNGRSPIEIIIQGRPLVMLGYFKRHTKSITLAHELTHVKQLTDEALMPLEEFFNSDTGLRWELEAYHNSGLMEQTVIKEGIMSAEEVGDISEEIRAERIRKKHARPGHPFTPTPAMRKALRRSGVRWANPNYDSM